MEWFLLGLLAVAIPLLFLIMLPILWARVSTLQRRIEELEERLAGSAPVAAPPPAPVVPLFQPEPEPDAQPIRVAAKARRTATVTTAVAPPPAGSAKETPPPPPPRERQPINFEELVGGKLPIWVGGIALVFAGFFLVRYTIEAGLFGPGARCIAATLFAFLLIAFSEFGGRLPKVGEAFKADPRVGQATAGAGIAVLYGTLYMAAEIYGLMGIAAAFVAVVAVTILAFGLSLRHGPPTALMGVAGGFAAPWVAGMGADTMPTLLLYLAVFIAALYGLAVWRRWLWLLLLASGGGAIWTLALLATADSQLALLGGFILATGAAGVIVLQRFPGEAQGLSALARYGPATLALIQLAMLIPRLEFSATGWLFYGILSLLSVVLAWRDKRMVPLVGGAMLLAIAPLGGAWYVAAKLPQTLAATFGYVLLFAGAGHVKGREEDAGGWAIIALAAPVLAWFCAMFGAYPVYSQTIWGLWALLAALPSAAMAWDRHQRSLTGASVQVAATAATALMVMIGGAFVFEQWITTVFALTALGVAAWAKRTGTTALSKLAIVPLTLAFVGIAVGGFDLLNALGASLIGQQLIYWLMPTVADATRDVLLPTALVALIAWKPLFAIGSWSRRAVYIVAGAGLAGFIWLLAKQVAAIETPAEFINMGFAERMIFTQVFFIAGWLALREAPKHPAWPSIKFTGIAATAIAAFRFVYFDLLLLNPVTVPQALGSAPIANLGTIHCALAAIWLWLASRQFEKPATRQALAIGSLLATIVTALVTVRQLVHGSLINGDYVQTSENYLYSAALLVLAIAWLARGLMLGHKLLRAKLLRVAGLSLLTAVTFKVFLVDAAALTGVLRILSFLGLGIALIGIGWAYGRIMGAGRKTSEPGA